MLKNFLLLPGRMVRLWWNLMFVFGGIKNLSDAEQFAASNTDFGLKVNAVVGWLIIVGLILFF